ncbi:MAG: aminoacyl-tRNA hydrolase [Henriciella sp.]
MFQAISQWVAGWLKSRSATFDSTQDEDSQIMHILLGQGNPGTKYAGNRHNVGFMVLDAIADEYGFSPWRSKFQGAVCEGSVAGHKLLLLKPETFYNETGRAAQAAAKFYKLSAEDVTVFHDEIDLAPGRVRIKRGGGHSGNNGIRSMIAHLGAEVRRVRIGVGHPGDKSQVMPYVLANFAKADEAWRDATIAACAKALPLALNETDERYQTEIMRLAPAPKHDPKQAG